MIQTTYILHTVIKLNGNYLISEAWYKNTKMHNNIVNLSKTFYLTDLQEQVCYKGLTFIPTPRVSKLGEVSGDVHAYNRKF